MIARARGAARQPNKNQRLRALLAKGAKKRAAPLRWHDALGHQTRNQPQSELFFQIKMQRPLEDVTVEHRFHEFRRWRFDIAFTVSKLAIEIDGGGFVQGRHSRGKGIEADCEKYAEAMIHGWRVLRVTPKHVKSGEALAWIEKLLR